MQYLKPQLEAQLTRAKKRRYVWAVEIDRRKSSMHLMLFYRKPASIMRNACKFRFVYFGGALE